MVKVVKVIICLMAKKNSSQKSEKSQKGCRCSTLSSQNYGCLIQQQQQQRVRQLENSIQSTFQKTIQDNLVLTKTWINTKSLSIFFVVFTRKETETRESKEELVLRKQAQRKEALFIVPARWLCPCHRRHKVLPDHV